MKWLVPVAASWIGSVFVAGGLFGCGASGGIHARMAYSEEGGLRVVDVPPGPSMDGGIKVGDRVVAIDGEPVHGLSLQEIIERLRGRTATSVQLEVARDGEVRMIDVERARYED